MESWFARARPTDGDVNVYLVSDDKRSFTQEEFTRVWREEIGDLPEVKSLFLEYLVGPGGNRGLSLNLSHTSTAVLETAARELAQRLDERARRASGRTPGWTPLVNKWCTVSHQKR